MKKRILSLVVILVMAIGLAQSFAFAKTTVDNAAIETLEKEHFQHTVTGFNGCAIKGAGNSAAFNDLKNYIISHGTTFSSGYDYTFGSSDTISFSARYYTADNEIALFSTFLSSNGAITTAAIWIDSALSGNYTWMCIIDISGTKFTAAGYISSSYNKNMSISCDYYDGLAGVKESTIKTSKTIVDGILNNFPINLVKCGLYYHYADFNLNEYFYCISSHTFTNYTNNGDGTKTRHCKDCYLYQTEKATSAPVNTGTQNAVSNNLSAPLSAWTNTIATYKRHAYTDSSTTYEIQLKELYIGDEANDIVESENHFNDNPTSTQQWILMKWNLKNVNGSTELDASDIIFNNFYTTEGASVNIIDHATLSKSKKNIHDVSLYSGASSDVWIGILVDKEVGYPLLRLNNGYDSDKKALYCFISTDPEYEYTAPAVCYHQYSNNCDTSCNICGETRTATHTYTDGCDTTCNVCNEYRNASHEFGEYDSNYDATIYSDGTKSRYCQVCGYEETVTDYGSKLPSSDIQSDLMDTSRMFNDVKSGSWYKEYVDYAVTHGIFNGTTATTFAPSMTMTRAQFVQVLANVSGVDTNNKNIATSFSDVPAGRWFTPAVKWASDNGIVTGTGNGKFAPNDNVTREQMCAMIVRYASYKSLTLKQTQSKAYFADDSKISSWAKDAVYTCQMAEIVGGKGNNKFDPKATGSRAEAATIFTRFHKNYIA